MTAPAWFCAAHHLWTTSDCPRCDDELIAAADEAEAWRERPTHDVTTYGGRFMPCFCYADRNHAVGQERRS